jgi:ER-bound oxygenase mpaB/B'/Rubber oxygenase, catalytic domain
MTVQNPDEDSVTPSPDASAEIERLDPVADYERIAFLLTYQLFPWDIERALELALFNTYAIPSISGVLQRTGEFVTRPRKRYDDTVLILAEIGENGLASERGEAALGRMNAMHERFKIANEDYLYVLSTFMLNPIDWLADYGRRAMTEREQAAWFNSYLALGRAMGISNIPTDIRQMRILRERFEVEHMVFAPSNRVVANATLDLLLSMYLPRWLNWFGRPIVLALCKDRLVTAIGQKPQPRWRKALIGGVMRLRARALRLLPENRSVRPITQRRTPTYPTGYDIAALGTFAPGGGSRARNKPRNETASSSTE